LSKKNINQDEKYLKAKENDENIEMNNMGPKWSREGPGSNARSRVTKFSDDIVVVVFLGKMINGDVVPKNKVAAIRSSSSGRGFRQ
jgi:hypothetical protein